MAKQFSFLLLSFLFILSCGPDKGTVRLEGELAGIKQAEFYVMSEDGAFAGVDTIRIEDGKFTYERRLPRAALLTLLYPNYTQTYLVAQPGETVRMKGDAAKLSAAEITGTKENELLSDFRTENLTKPASTVRLAATHFIETHPATLAAEALFRQYFVNVAEPDGRAALPLLDALTKARKADKDFAAQAALWRPVLLTAKGQPCPDFSASTLAGRPVKKADFKGKPFLLLTLASWEGQSYAWLRHAAALQKKYGERLGIVVVVADFDARMAKERFKVDTLRGVAVVNEGRGLDAPMMQTLALRSVPGNLIVDKRGIITARDVKETEMHAELERVM